MAGEVSMSIAVAVGHCRENEKMAGCWWHTVALAAAVTVAVRGCHEDEKVAG